MRDDTEPKPPKLSWPKSLVRKWFDIKSKSVDFQAGDDLDYSGGDEGFSSRFSEREAWSFRKSKTERKRNAADRLRRGESNPAFSQITNVDNYRIFVSTWNVAGKSPPSYLGLDDWLHTSPPADIYVLGFQEIVPLNAGNVLGTEDNGPARKWLSLIRKTLNTIPGNCSSSHSASPVPGPFVELEDDFEGLARGTAAPYFHRRSFNSLSRSTRADNDMSMKQPRLDRRFSVCDRVISGYRNTDSSEDEYGPCGSPNTTHYSPVSYSGSTSLGHREMASGNSRYCLVANKQMVGIFLTVWVRRDLRDDARNVKVSCVGRGLMGYLGNKVSFNSLSRSTRADNDMSMKQPRLDRRFSVCDRVISGYRNTDSSEDEYGPCGSPNTTHYSPVSYSGSTSLGHREMASGNSRYCLVANKQMVGIFLTVWVRRDLRDDARNVKVSCVGRGLMGYLGNKGSISISMKLHQTSFCFVCSHLTSGQKEGDELRRNSDVMEILRKTKFPMAHRKGSEDSPQTILDHDRVIWLGDLNYRIALSYRCAKALLEMHNWRALLEKDQLRVERRQGRVFQGWKEGRIYFPPTYKYSLNSDQYAGDAAQRKEKRRTPAWCDRILWYGQGLRQLSYDRGVSRFSDHRPVSSVFLAKVESFNHDLFKKSMGYSSSKVEVEELLPYHHNYRKNQLSY